MNSALVFTQGHCDDLVDKQPLTMVALLQRTKNFFILTTAFGIYYYPPGHLWALLCLIYKKS